MQWTAEENSESAAFFPEQLIQQVVSAFEGEAKKKQIALEVIVEGELRQEFLGDTSCLKSILEGLLSNAVKYTACGGRILFYAWARAGMQKGNGLYFQVMDTGCGVKKKDYKKIFDKKLGVLSEEGQLELAEIKRVTEEMGGAVFVQSKVGRGSVFTVKVPFHRSARKMEEKRSMNDFKNMALQGKSVLVVEDDELNREIAMEILKIMGAKVVSAQNGKEAVEVFALSEINTYDYIMMDMQMPVMDGCSATRKIRAMEREDARRIPIIAVTGNSCQDSKSRCLESGMSAFMKKPFRIKALEQCLKTL